MCRAVKRIISVGFFAAFTTHAFAGDTPAGPSCKDMTQGEFSVLIRNDFTDLGPFSCTHNLLSSQGATFSWTNNLLTKQNSGSLDGLVALDYTLYNYPGNFFQGLSVGAFVQEDDTYQLQPTATQSHNGYTLTPGGFAELDFFHSLPWAGIDSFRVREGQAIGSTDTRYDSFVGEWIPTYNIGYLLTNQPARIPGTWMYYTFTPELMVQYDQFVGGPKTPALFSTYNEALRIGPQVALILNFERVYLPKGVGFLKDFAVQFTNHESWDQDTGKEYTWTSVALIYTFPKTPNFGLSASYGYGNSEATGNQTNQIKAGFAAKL